MATCTKYKIKESCQTPEQMIKEKDKGRKIKNEVQDCTLEMGCRYSTKLPSRPLVLTKNLFKI